MRTSDIVTALKAGTPTWGGRAYDSEPIAVRIPMLVVFPVSRMPKVVAKGRSLGIDSLNDSLFQIDLYEKEENGSDELAVYTALDALHGVVEVQSVVYQHESYGVRCIFTIHCLGA